MSATNVTPDGEPILFEGRIFKVVERTQVGRSGKILKRQVVKHPGAVAIVPILPDGRVLLIEQYRVALQKTIFEIPAGTREVGEEPLLTATRELIEETGYSAGKVERLTAIYSSPGILQEELILYLATDLTPGESAPEDGEKIELRPKTWEEIDAMIAAEEIVDAKTLVALLLARQALNVGC